MLKLNFAVLPILLSMFCISNVQAGPAATTTTLAITPGATVTAGTSVTLTATVVTTVGGAMVTPGIVLFCDANATFCEDSAILGGAQLGAAGTASVKVTLGAGTYNVFARFAGTLGAGASDSAPTLLTISPNATYASTTTIAPPSGTSPNFTLTGTVASFGKIGFTGNISFLDTSNGNASLASAAPDPATLALLLTPKPNLADILTPNAVVVADFNGDGIPDVVIANFDGGNVSVFLGVGDGTFAAAVDYTVGLAPNAIVAGDVDNNGFVDLVVSNSEDGSITVLINQGDGTFVAKPPIFIGAVQGMVLGDFNGDGNLDIAATIFGTPGNVVVLLGDGAGGFAQNCPDGCVSFPVGNNPGALVAADINKDGNLDVVVTNHDSNTISILPGNGDGTFQPQSVLSTGTAPTGIAAGDFNNDGAVDIAVTNNGDNTVTIFLNNGTGTLAALPTTAPTGALPSGIVAGDFNGDGKLDLAVTNVNEFTVYVLLGDGTGAFPTHVSGNVGNTPVAIAAGDFNGDGLPDLVAVNSGGAQGASIFVIARSESATANVTPTPGTHNVLASYAADTARIPSQSTTVPLVVLTTTTTTLTANPANSSVFGQSVTFTATVAPPPGSGPAFGAVNFVNNPVGGPVTLNTANVDATGTATFTTSNLAVANYSLTAAYSGNADSAASTSALTPYTVAKANTSTSVTSSLNPSVSGQAVTFTATVSALAPGAGTPTGLVTFLVNGSSIGTGALSAGVATLITPNVPVGSQTITTTYSGSNSFNGSAGSLTGNPQVVNPANTTLSLTSSVNPSVFGQRITFSANVSVVAPGGGGPSSGTVTFFDNGTMIGSGALGDGPAIFSISTLAVGNHPITATFGGNASFNGSTGTLTGTPQVVNKANTTTVLTTSASPSTFGQSATLTATISPQFGGSPSGTVTFKSGTTVIGSPVAVSGGTAVLITTALLGGTQNLTAVYSGDTNFTTSTSAPVSFTVNTATSTTLLTTSASPSTFGASVTLTATVSSAAAGTLTGTVTFKSGTTVIGSPVAVSGGTAVLITTALPGGTQNLTAVYSGDTNFTTSTSAPVSFTVNPATSTIVLTTSASPSTFGASVTLTATVSSAVTGTSTGTVTFKSGTTVIGSPVAVSGGTAALVTTALPTGTQSLTAVYSGDADFATSTSAPVSFTVNPATSTTVLTTSASPSAFGASVTLTATVSSTAAGTLTGTVTFKSGSTVIGSPVAISGGTAVLITTALLGGTQNLTAVYSGDTNFTTSTSAPISFTVNPATSTTVLTTSASPSTFGASVTFTATVSSAAAGTLTGTVTFKSGSTVIGSPVAVSGGTAVLITTALPGGTQNLTAVYSGDTDFATSTSAPVSFTVNPATSTTVLTTSVSPSTFAQSVTLTATITPIPSGASLGSVNFFNGATNIGSGNVNASGVTTLTTAALPVGVLSLTAVYSGNGNFATSTSAAVSFTVNKVATTTALAVSPNPVIAGQTVTLTATITPTPAGAPLGTVDFFNGATNIGTSNVNGNGVATLITAMLPQGTLSLTATYSGNVDFATSTSPAQSLVVVTATTTALTAAPNPSTFGQSVTMTATVAPTPTGASFGTVNFFNGVTMLGTGNVNASGVATFSSTALPVGTLSLTAVYSGNAAFGTSTSSAFSLTVNVAPTTTPPAAPPSPGTFGQSITLTATIAPVPSGAALGSVNFFNGATNIGTGNVNASGVATLAITTLLAGNLTLSAVYSGNASFGPSTSAGLPLTVNTTFAVNAPVTSFVVVEGGSVPITINIPPLGGTFNNVVIMTATGLPPGATGTFVPPTVTPGAVGATTILTIQLAPLAANSSRPGAESGAPVPAVAFVAGLLLFIRRKHLRKSLRLAAIFMLVTLLGSTLMGCAGGFLRPPSTPPGAFMVTIAGTSGTTVNSTTVAVVVR